MDQSSREREMGDDALDEVVAQCLESPVHELDSAVESACARHPEHASAIRRRVAVLRSAGLVGPTGDTHQFPERLGEYRLLERLGAGGMGVVFRARQESLGRDVALKLIRPEHLYFPKARERFRREAEAVARLRHPGIVPVFAVGEASGLPYFAMELVEGRTLGQVIEVLSGRAPESLRAADLALATADSAPPTAHAGLHGSWTELVLRLTIQVAEALHHAHTQGVLHRDVKPSNIAVTADGHARLLDFGLAAIEDGSARVTAAGAEIGTLLYMSPEQLRGELETIDARTDVYALGVTLYELLTLQMPFSGQNSADIRQAILEGRTGALRARNRAVPRDLEIVCAKAMERDRDQRYADVAAFARDLRNVLELRPIEARPPSASLIARRWVQRHPGASIAALLAVLLVVGGPLVLLALARRHARELELALEDTRRAHSAATTAESEARSHEQRARLEAADAQSVSTFLVDLFGAADPANARGREPSARELLDEGLRRLDADLADQPEVRRRLRLRIGSSYASLGVLDRARECLERAVAESVELHGASSIEAAEAYQQFGWMLRNAGAPEALEWMRKASEIAQVSPQVTSAVRVRYAVGLASALTAQKRFDDALRAYADALAAIDTGSAEARELEELVYSNRAHTNNAARRLAEAVEDATRARDLQRELYGVAHPGLLASLNTLAVSLKNLGRMDEAAPVFDELLTVGERVHGRESLAYATFLANHASFLDDVGRAEEALARYEEAWTRFEALAPAAHPQRVTCRSNMAGVYMRALRWRDAERAYGDVAPVLREVDGPSSTRFPFVQNNLALCLEARGELDGAVAALSSARDFSLAQSGSGAELRVARLRVALGRVLARLERCAEAQAELDQVASFLERNPARAALAAPLRWARILCALRRPAAREALDQELRALAELQALDDDARWIGAAARAKLAARADDRAALQAARHELEQRLGLRHIEVLDALSCELESAARAGDRPEAARLEADLAARRAGL